MSRFVLLLAAALGAVPAASPAQIAPTTVTATRDRAVVSYADLDIARPDHRRVLRRRPVGRDRGCVRLVRQRPRMVRGTPRRSVPQRGVGIGRPPDRDAGRQATRSRSSSCADGGGDPGARRRAGPASMLSRPLGTRHGGTGERQRSCASRTVPDRRRRGSPRDQDPAARRTRNRGRAARDAGAGGAGRWPRARSSRATIWSRPAGTGGSSATTRSTASCRACAASPRTSAGAASRSRR